MPAAAAAAPADPGGGMAAAVPAAAPASVSGGMRYGILVATVIVPFVGIVMGLIYMFGGVPERKSVGKLWLIVGIFAMLFWIGMAGG